MQVVSLMAALALVTPCESMAELSDEALQTRAAMEFRAGQQHRDRTGEARPHYRAAAAVYDALRVRGAHNRELYRNLGNAALLGGNVPQAILAYRRGLRLNPDDHELRFLLSYARELVAYPKSGRFARPPEDPLPLWLPRLNPGWYLLGALLSYSLLCAAWTRWWLFREGSSASLVLFAAALTIGLAAGLYLEWTVRHRDEVQPVAVVARDGLLLRKGNGWSYPVNYDTPLNRGVEARLLFSRGDWLQIELAGGEVGWVPAQSVLRDTPDIRSRRMIKELYGFYVFVEVDGTLGVPSRDAGLGAQQAVKRPAKNCVDVSIRYRRK